jgi:hypothetical protein
MRLLRKQWAAGAAGVPRVGRGKDIIRYVGVLIVAALALVQGCHIGSECSDSSDCSEGYACIHNYGFGNCIPTCTDNSACQAHEYCDHEGFCSSGCRDASGCAETQWCNGGTCISHCGAGGDGCPAGRPGSACVGDSHPLPPQSAPNGECRPTCQTDADCAGAEFKQCVCGACLLSCEASTCPGSLVCRATGDCSTPRCFQFSDP